MITDRQIKGLLLIKQLEKKGKEWKRTLQLMWDREGCPHHGIIECFGLEGTL